MPNQPARPDFRPKTCCFTGHQDIAPWEEKKILTKLRYQVDLLIRQGYRYFGVGGARGFDRLAAEYLLDFRNKQNRLIKVISVLPYPGYMEGWNEMDIVRQGRINKSCDKVVYVCPDSYCAFLTRDRKLVDESSFCVCYCHKMNGGTAYTVRYAMKQKVPVYNLSTWDIRQLEYY